jgi:hypothetical protein
MLENSDQSIAKQLIRKYEVYFSYYRDFQCLVAVLAFSGLVVAISDWEVPFEKRDFKGNAIVERNTEFSVMIMMLTVLALIALFF